MRKKISIICVLTFLVFFISTIKSKAEEGIVTVRVMDKNKKFLENIEITSLPCDNKGRIPKNVKTDARGYAKIETSENLCVIVVKGKTNKGEYNIGRTYSFTVN